ncbi:MAG: hypothetical protein HY280_10340, partial [Nitrospinae bacterium]|nr:hypothetical protein [Nitrospinota bacterium]
GLFFLASPFGAFAEDDAKLLLQLNDNNGYYSGSGDYGRRGGQNVVYSTASYLTKGYGLSVLGAYTDTTYNYVNESDKTNGDFHLNTAMDTTVSGFYILGGGGTNLWRIGLDLNLPTGHASYNSQEENTVMTAPVTQDLVMMPSFGAGLNIAPNVTLVHGFSEISTGGLGVRYQKSGSYTPTPSDSASPLSYTPGDWMMIFGSFEYTPSKENQLLLDVSKTLSARDKQGPTEVLKQGDRYLTGAKYINTGAMDKTTYSFTYQWQDANQISSGSSGVVTQSRNANNNKAEVFVQDTHMQSEKLALNAIVGGKKVYANQMDVTDSYYVAGYAKVYAGGGFTYAASKMLTVTFDLRLFELWSGTDPTEPSGITYRGGNMDLGFVYEFGGAPDNAQKPAK